jgi:hypothetical protein
MSEHRLLALAALSSLRIRSPTSYSWCGTVSAPVAPEVERAMTPEVAREFLVYQLQQEMYGNFYCRGFPAAGVVVHGGGGIAGSSAFVESLSRANRARSSLQPGWRVREQSEDSLVVERDGLALWVAPSHAVPDEVSGNVSLRLPGELRKASPGFYMALGEHAITEEQSARLVRLYWHLTSAAAPRLLERLTDSLNRAKVPFQLKVVNDPERYTRCDAGVLYLPRELFREVVAPIRDAHRLLAGELRATTPVFTKRLAPGLGLAEDPGGGQSFGMHRALVMAQAAVRAHERGCLDEEDRTALLTEAFAEQGLELDVPFLSPGSSDAYALEGR